ncbi:hypothetical protein MGH68_18975 [Erysipelothrix sp. D19-032]
MIKIWRQLRGLQGDTAFGFTFSKPYDAFTQNPDLETFDERLWSENELKSNRDRSKDKSIANQETKINGTKDSKTSQTDSKNSQSSKSTKNENIDSMTANGEVIVPDFSTMSRDAINKWATKHKIDIEFAQSNKVQTCLMTANFGRNRVLRVMFFHKGQRL